MRPRVHQVHGQERRPALPVAAQVRQSVLHVFYGRRDQREQPSPECGLDRRAVRGGDADHLSDRIADAGKPRGIVLFGQQDVSHALLVSGQLLLEVKQQRQCRGDDTPLRGELLQLFLNSGIVIVYFCALGPERCQTRLDRLLLFPEACQRRRTLSRCGL